MLNIFNPIIFKEVSIRKWKFLIDSEKLGSQFRLPYVTFVIIIFSDSYKVNLIKNLPH